MFGFKKSERVTKKMLEKMFDKAEHSHRLEIKRLKSDHDLSLRKYEFERRHFKDDRIKELNELLIQKNKKLAVLERENSLLEKEISFLKDLIKGDEN